MSCEIFLAPPPLLSRDAGACPCHRRLSDVTRGPFRLPGAGSGTARPASLGRRLFRSPLRPQTRAVFAMAVTRSFSADSYFKRTHPGWMALIAVAFGYFTWTVFFPTTVPFDQLGPLGCVSRYMVDNYYSVLYVGYWLAWAVHIAEAAYTVKLCSIKGITNKNAQMLWAGQTFLFGIASLHLLRAYKPDFQKKLK